MLNQTRKISIVALSIVTVFSSIGSFANPACAGLGQLNLSPQKISRPAPKIAILASGDKYAAIWSKSSSTAWVARHGMTSAQYQSEFDKYVAQGYRLIEVSGYGVNGKDRYAAIWDKSPSTAWVARHGMTSAQYQAEFDKYVAQGYRLVQVSGYGVNGQDYYAAIWDKSPSTAWVARHGMTSAQYELNLINMSRKATA